jgi:hypothetical protein
MYQCFVQICAHTCLVLGLAPTPSGSIVASDATNAREADDLPSRSVMSAVRGQCVQTFQKHMHDRYAVISPKLHDYAERHHDKLERHQACFKRSS